MARLEIESEVQGNVWKVLCEAGADVEAGQVLLIIESMKMEIPVEAPAAGRLIEMNVKPEDVVEEDQLLAVVESG
jgi:biotin carboxyl carrier protein